MTPFEADRDRFDKALAPFVRTNTDSGGVEFSYIDQTCPQELRDLYWRFMQYGFATGQA